MVVLDEFRHFTVDLSRLDTWKVLPVNDFYHFHKYRKPVSASLEELELLRDRRASKAEVSRTQGNGKARESMCLSL